MKRWFQYQELPGYNFNKTLVCCICHKFKGKLRSMIWHFGNNHTPNFVSIELFKAQTYLWRN